MPPALVVHAHLYQPPRENPWTEEVAREASAAPFHDWNARIDAECYRPNAAARVLDEAGRVVDIVDNYANLSFDAGPTLLSWLERHAPWTYRRILEADAAGGGAMAQAYGHMILPLATPRDVRTQVRWGLADFEHRFGRRSAGMWLPETAANDTVLAVLAEEGVGFTVLAPGQARRVRPLGGGDDAWVGVEGGGLDTRQPYRWLHPDGSGRGVDVVFYDGGLSHAVAFEIGGLSSQALLERVAAAGQGLVTVAADGETFGHHHRWGERLVAHALAVEAPRRGVEVTHVAGYLSRVRPAHEVEVVESSWSCAHGVGRWREDCGCSTGGPAGWHQRWRAPLRQALDRLRDRAADVHERRGAAVLADPWQARDAYVRVLLGAVGPEEFAAGHVVGDPVVAFSLLEAQRHAMAMYTSCGWFFHDLAGLETVQVLRYAARVIDLLEEIGEDAGEDAFLEVLAKAESNQPAEGNGRDVWHRHVVPARVDAERVVANVALADLLERRPPDRRVGAFGVDLVDHARADRAGLALCSGRVALTHLRTGRRSQHVYAALHRGGLEVLGASRPAAPEEEADTAALALLRASFDDGAPLTTLVRLVSEGFGPGELDLRAALPDAAEHIVERTARALADRFAAAYERLFEDHRGTLEALAAAGYPFPAELRAPAELALGRRLEAEVVAQAGSLDRADYARAVTIAREATASGVVLDVPAVRQVVEHLLVAATERAVLAAGAAAGAQAVDAAIGVLGLARDLGLRLSWDRPQELVHAALRDGAGRGRGRVTRPHLRRLGAALGLAV